VRSAHEVALRVLTAGLIDIGLLRGGVDEALETEAYKPFYMHGTGHWIGWTCTTSARTRCATARRSARSSRDGRDGRAGLYINRDLDVDERFKGIGVRIEDDVLCGPNGPDVLSEGIPKEIAEVEEIVGSGALARA